MYLELQKLVIHDFKSYKSTHVISFDRFTCISGANGSGKSNILDSFMFCFGFNLSKIRYFDVQGSPAVQCCFGADQEIIDSITKKHDFLVLFENTISKSSRKNQSSKSKSNTRIDLGTLKTEKRISEYPMRDRILNKSNLTDCSELQDKSALCKNSFSRNDAQTEVFDKSHVSAKTLEYPCDANSKNDSELRKFTNFQDSKIPEHEKQQQHLQINEEKHPENSGSHKRRTCSLNNLKEIRIKRVFSRGQSTYTINEQPVTKTVYLDVVDLMGIDTGKFLVQQGEIETLSLKKPLVMLEYIEKTIGSNILIPHIQKSEENVLAFKEQQTSRKSVLQVLKNEYKYAAEKLKTFIDKCMSNGSVFVFNLESALKHKLALMTNLYISDIKSRQQHNTLTRLNSANKSLKRETLALERECAACQETMSRLENEMVSFLSQVCSQERELSTLDSNLKKQTLQIRNLFKQIEKKCESNKNFELEMNSINDELLKNQNDLSDYEKQKKEILDALSAFNCIRTVVEASKFNHCDLKTVISEYVKPWFDNLSLRKTEILCFFQNSVQKEPFGDFVLIDENLNLYLESPSFNEKIATLDSSKTTVAHLEQNPQDNLIIRYLKRTFQDMYRFIKEKHQHVLSEEIQKHVFSKNSNSVEQMLLFCEIFNKLDQFLHEFRATNRCLFDEIKSLILRDSFLDKEVVTYLSDSKTLMTDFYKNMGFQKTTNQNDDIFQNMTKSFLRNSLQTHELQDFFNNVKTNDISRIEIISKVLKTFNQNSTGFNNTYSQYMAVLIDNIQNFIQHIKKYSAEVLESQRNEKQSSFNSKISEILKTIPGYIGRIGDICSTSTHFEQAISSCAKSNLNNHLVSNTHTAEVCIEKIKHLGRVGFICMDKIEKIIHKEKLDWVNQVRNDFHKNLQSINKNNRDAQFSQMDKIIHKERLDWVNQVRNDFHKNLQNIDNHKRDANFSQITFSDLDTAQQIYEKISRPDFSDYIINFVSFDERYTKVFYFIFNETIVANNLDLGKKIAFNKNRKRVVTLDGELIEKSGLMSGRQQLRGRNLIKVDESLSKSANTPNIQELQDQALLFKKQIENMHAKESTNHSGDNIHIKTFLSELNHAESTSHIKNMHAKESTNHSGDNVHIKTFLSEFNHTESTSHIRNQDNISYRRYFETIFDTPAVMSKLDHVIGTKTLNNEECENLSNFFQTTKQQIKDRFERFKLSRSNFDKLINKTLLILSDKQNLYKSIGEKIVSIIGNRSKLGQKIKNTLNHDSSIFVEQIVDLSFMPILCLPNLLQGVNSMSLAEFTAKNPKTHIPKNSEKNSQENEAKETEHISTTLFELSKNSKRFLTQEIENIILKEAEGVFQSSKLDTIPSLRLSNSTHLKIIDSTLNLVLSESDLIQNLNNVCKEQLSSAIESLENSEPIEIKQKRAEIDILKEKINLVTLRNITLSTKLSGMNIEDLSGLKSDLNNRILIYHNMKYVQSSGLKNEDLNLFNSEDILDTDEILFLGISEKFLNNEVFNILKNLDNDGCSQKPRYSKAKLILKKLEKVKKEHAETQELYNNAKNSHKTLVSEIKNLKTRWGKDYQKEIEIQEEINNLQNKILTLKNEIKNTNMYIERLDCQYAELIQIFDKIASDNLENYFEDSEDSNEMDNISLPNETNDNVSALLTSKDIFEEKTVENQNNPNSNHSEKVDKNELALRESIENVPENISVGQNKENLVTTNSSQKKKQISPGSVQSSENNIDKFSKDFKKQVSEIQNVLSDKIENTENQYANILQKIIQKQQLENSHSKEETCENFDEKTSQTNEDVVNDTLSGFTLKKDRFTAQYKNFESIDIAVLDDHTKKKKEVFEEIQKYKDFRRTSKQEEKKLSKLKKRRDDLFKSGLRSINSNLRKVYQKISNGGQAQLDPIEADPYQGIVLSVKPPQKTWKRLEILSGGEKTLASISLVLAIHQYRPSPFYLLDEIDAALDYKNTCIIAQYLKKTIKDLEEKTKTQFLQEALIANTQKNSNDNTQNIVLPKKTLTLSQFIVVSHRKGFIEQADTIVGVYKSESSKIAVFKMNALKNILQQKS